MNTVTKATLQARCDEVGAKYTRNHTKADLMRILRARVRHVTTPMGTDTLNFGQHGGRTYAEVLRDAPQYAKWVQTTAAEDDASPELMRFAGWLNMMEVGQEAEDAAKEAKKDTAQGAKKDAEKEPPKTATKEGQPTTTTRASAPSVASSSRRSATATSSSKTSSKEPGTDERENIKEQVAEAKQMLAELLEENRPRKKASPGNVMEMDISTPEGASQDGTTKAEESQAPTEPSATDKKLESLTKVLANLTGRLSELEDTASSTGSWAHASRRS